jgi:hypothetical protein
MKKNSRLLHIDLSNTFLAEKAVHYIIKRLAKSVNIQSVHLSGVREQLSHKTKKFIRKMLDPLDMR